MIQAMLALGADPNAHVQIGGPVINIAVSLNHTRVAELLVAHGANVNYYGGGAGTPLMSAIENDNPYMVHLLLTHGADVNMKNGKGRAPLHSAVMGTVDNSTGEPMRNHVLVTDRLLRSGKSSVRTFKNIRQSKPPQEMTPSNINVRPCNLPWK